MYVELGLAATEAAVTLPVVAERSLVMLCSDLAATVELLSIADEAVAKLSWTPAGVPIVDTIPVRDSWGGELLQPSDSSGSELRRDDSSSVLQNDV